MPEACRCSRSHRRLASNRCPGRCSHPMRRRSRSARCSTCHLGSSPVHAPGRRSGSGHDRVAGNRRRVAVRWRRAIGECASGYDPTENCDGEQRQPQRPPDREAGMRARRRRIFHKMFDSTQRTGPTKPQDRVHTCGRRTPSGINWPPRRFLSACRPLEDVCPTRPSGHFAKCPAHPVNR